MTTDKPWTRFTCSVNLTAIYELPSRHHALVRAILVTFTAANLRQVSKKKAYNNFQQHHSEAKLKMHK